MKYLNPVPIMLPTNKVNLESKALIIIIIIIIIIINCIILKNIDYHYQ